MTLHKTELAVLTAALIAALAPAVLANGHQHADDVVVGRTAADQLAFELPHETTFLLPASGNPFLHGWLDSAPGFDALVADEPDEDLYTLGAGANIRLVVQSIDPGLVIWSSTLSEWAEAPGEWIALGGSSLHTHPLWHLDSDVLGAGWVGSRSATLYLQDVGTTGYAASDPFTLTFTNVVPEPTTLALLAAGGLGLAVRRRRMRAGQPASGG